MSHPVEGEITKEVSGDREDSVPGGPTLRSWRDERPPSLGISALGVCQALLPAISTLQLI